MAITKSKRARVLIVSLPGFMQNVLRETFARRTDVVVVGVASGCLSVLGMLPDAKPDLVVIDSNLPEAETSQLIARLKQEQYPLKLLVLAETTQQLNKANKSGADITLRSYSLPDKLDLVLGRVGIKPVDQ